MENKNILVVEDDNATRDTMVDLLSEAGYEVESARNGEDAIAMAQEYSFNIVITDLKMPKGDGIQVLEQIKKIDPRTIVIICTGYGTVDTAVKSMKLGAYEYITKPIKIEEIKLVVQRALNYQRLKTENVLLQSHHSML